MGGYKSASREKQKIVNWLQEVLKEQQQQKLLEKFMKRQHLAVILVTVAVMAFSSVTLVLLGNIPVDREPVHYTYNVVNVYPHDEAAFTQGLVFEDGFLYEGTGLYGQSTLRRVELETGNITQLHSLPDNFFGEGITIFEDKTVQLTWKSGKGFVYDRSSFTLLQTFEYPTEEGWGITHDGSRLIMSDGTATLYFLDPETFQTTGQLEVYDEEPVTLLNELEYINGRVYANIWKKDQIAIINPETGNVTGWIDLSGINDAEKTSENVLNGIAYEPNGDRLFVTGKMWSQLFEIELVPAE